MAKTIFFLICHTFREIFTDSKLKDHTVGRFIQYTNRRILASITDIICNFIFGNLNDNFI